MAFECYCFLSVETDVQQRRSSLINIMESLTEVGHEQPLAFFAAVELARDGLGADYVARGLLGVRSCRLA